MPETSTKEIAKNSFWVTAGFAIERVAQLVAQVFLARLLSPEDFGIWAMVLILTRLSMEFRDKATATVLVQRGLGDVRVVNAVYSLTINISILMFLVQTLAGYPLALFFGEPLVFPLTACTALVFLVGAGAGSHGAVLQRQMKFRALAISEGLAGVTRFSSILIAAACGLGVWSFAISEVAMAVVDSLGKRWFSRYPFQYSLIPDAVAIAEVKSYITQIINVNLALYLNTNGDNFIIGRWLGTKALGYYNLAYQLAMLPLFALSKINQVNFSVLSQKDHDRKLSYLVKSLELYGVSYTLLYGIGYLISPWLIPLVYGQEWTPAVVLFQIVLVYAYARGFMYILGTALNAIDRPGVNAAVNWILVPLAIPAFLIGIRLGGLSGVAIAVSLALGVLGSLIFFWVLSRTANWSLTTLIQPVIPPTLAICLAIAIATRIPNLTWYSIFLQVGMLVVVYIMALHLFSQGRSSRLVLKLAHSVGGK
ncbi:MAG: oligosaccharide flippase family protein [Cyanobacteria bacterium J06629_2]